MRLFPVPVSTMYEHFQVPLLVTQMLFCFTFPPGIKFLVLLQTVPTKIGIGRANEFGGVHVVEALQEVNAVKPFVPSNNHGVWELQRIPVHNYVLNIFLSIYCL